MSGTELSDQSIIQQVLPGERDSFATLVNRYLRTVHSVAMAQTRNASDAEDVTQETFLKAFTHLHTLRNPAQFAPWLVAICRNTARNVVAKRRTVPITESIEVETAIPPEDIETKELLRELKHQIYGLRPLYREVLLLHYYDHKTTEEIALILGISRHAAKKRLSRGRDELGKRFIAHIGALFGDSEKEIARKKKTLFAITGVRPDWQTPSAATFFRLPTIISKLAANPVLTTAFVVAVTLAVAGVVIHEPRSARTQNAESAAVENIERLPVASSAENAAPSPTGTALASPRTAAESPAQENPAGPGSIHGNVVSANGTVVANAAVQLHHVAPSHSSADISLQHPVWNLRSDDQGRFSQEKLPVGYFVVLAHTDSLAGAAPIWLNATMTIDREVSIELAPRVSIAGRVVDTSGRPIENARVSAAFPHEMNVEQSWPAIRDLPATSNAKGEFAFPTLWQQTWTLDASAPGYASVSVEEIAGPADGVVVTMGEGIQFRGRTFDNASGKPVPKAQIRLRAVGASTRAYAISDADGNYTIDGLDSGAYRLQVEHDTFFTLEPFQDLQLATGVSIKEWDISMKQGGMINGRVVHAESGAPVEHCTLAIEDAPPHTRAKSGPDGRYTLRGVPAGKAKISIPELPFGYPRSQIIAPQELDVFSGRVANAADFRLSRPIAIQGRILDELGQAVSFASVYCAAPGGIDEAVLSNETGAFEIWLSTPASEAYLMGRKRGHARTVVGPFTIPAEGITGMEIVLGRESTISGVVLDQRGRPMKGQKLVAIPNSTYRFGLPTDTTDASGKFTLTGLFPEKYNIRWSAPWTNSDAPPSTVYELQDEITVPVIDGEHVNDLRVVLRPKGGRVITGRIVDSDGEPVGGAFVHAQEAYDGGNIDVANTRSNNDGTFELTGLDGDRYMLSVRARGFNLPPVDVVYAGAQGLHFALTRTGSVRGRVVDADSGAPVLEARITIAQSDNESMVTYNDDGARVQSTAGEYRVDDVPTGRVVLAADAPGYARSVSEPLFMVAGGELVDVEIQLDRGAVVHGTVRDSQESPVSSALIFLDEQPHAPNPSDADAITDAEGHFRLDSLTPQKPCRLVAVYPGYAPSLIEIIPTAAEPKRVILTMEPGGTIDGVLTFNGALLPGQFINVMEYHANPFPPGDGKIMHLNNGRAVVQTNAAGAFRLDNVPAGRAIVRARLQDRDGFDAPPLTLEQRVDIANNRTTTASMDFGAAWCTLEGVITSQNGAVADETVNVAVTRGPETVTSYTSSDANGRYHFELLPPGSAEILIYYDDAQGTEQIYSAQLTLQASESHTLPVHLDRE